MKTIQITFSVKHFGEIKYVDGEDGLQQHLYERNTVKEIVDYYHFERIFGCKNLTKMVWAGRLHFSAGPDTRKVLEDVAEWIRLEFDKRNGQHVEMEISWR